MILHLDNVELTCMHINKYKTNCLKTDHILTEKLHQNCFYIVLYNPHSFFQRPSLTRGMGSPTLQRGTSPTKP